MLEDLIEGLIGVYQKYGNLSLGLLLQNGEIIQFGGYLMINQDLTIKHRDSNEELFASSIFKPDENILMFF
jgi:hypothetical protein